MIPQVLWVFLWEVCEERCMSDVFDRILGKKVAGTRVVPLMLKIVTIFTAFLLVSNFATNYINLVLNRGEQVRLMNRLLVKDLKDLYVFTNNQAEIFDFNRDLDATVANIEESAARELRGERSVALGVRPDGTMFFEATNMDRLSVFPDEEALHVLQAERDEGREEGVINFTFAGYRYFGVFKYASRWDAFLVRAEELTEFYADSVRIFRNVSLLIIVLTLISVVVGVFLIRHILRFVGIITTAIMRMTGDQKLELVDMTGAPNDDVTYLGVAFNSLANTIDNLLSIFKKFVTRDTATRAYRDRDIRLEGTSMDLSILFSDIKGFTTITEALGTDIITLLNMHFDRAIRHVHENNGDVGSIIGDALLALFGVMSKEGENKSYQAIRTGYLIQEVAASLRSEMHVRREELLRRRGSLTEPEEKVFRAVLLEVGVGIDGGEVFYGNIGSVERMVNTVIGDSVNAASRLEGLTRVYQVPIIVSDYIKQETERDYGHYEFIELDTVMVKGKTLGKRVFWPIEKRLIDPQMRADLDAFHEGLRLYYDGAWPQAYDRFRDCSLSLADVFRERTDGATAPRNWNGIWTMTSK